MTQLRRALVTGAAGFLGSHLSDALIDRGYEVVGADDFSTSDPHSKHFTALLRRDRFSFRRVNVAEPGALAASIGGPFSLVANLACPASPPAYQSMPMHTLMTSVVGTSACIQIARSAGAVLLHASTSEVYGDPRVTPQPESYWGHVNSWGPRACYDEGKRAAEAALWIASDDVDVRVARIFNTYGPRMRLGDGRVVTEFVRAIMEGRSLPVFGDGSQTRSLCFVDDLVSGLLALAALDAPPGCPVNLGSDREVTIRQLGEALQAVTGRTVGFQSRPLPADDPSNRRPDLSLARRLFRWEPRVSLEDGLRATYDWFAALRMPA